ncbi:MAG: GNAT family N-acetyltransferase [Owenweeksia sp.]|nr:GNAT family N-acetyltransferase [Owenweeksia sp.]MBF98559.1 GNAT family N-acetyltransferase [Owenweeksia sp.]
MPISIRLALLNDAATIATLSDQLGYRSQDDSIQKRLKQLLNNHDHLVLVALKDNEVTGWIHCFYNLRVESDPFVEIGGLVVDEGHRQSGIGKMLVEEILAWARKKGCEKVRVRCNVIRRESHRFYEKIGFTENKEQKVFDIKPG